MVFVQARVVMCTLIMNNDETSNLNNLRLLDSYAQHLIMSMLITVNGGNRKQQKKKNEDGRQHQCHYGDMCVYVRSTP